MGAYSVASRKTATLVAATEDTVVLTAAGIRRIEVINHDASVRISANVNGDAATVDGDGTKPVLPGAPTCLYDANDEHRFVFAAGAVITVRLISSGTPTYTVVAY